MKGFTKWLVRHRILVIILCLMLVVPSVLGMAATKTKYDLLYYLPEELETIKGQGILLDDFGKGAYAMFVAEDMTDSQVAALKEDRIGDFLQLIIDSGRSSYMYLQNVFADYRDQSLSLALCMAEEMLRDDGAWRVHGGGFAGTTLNFVPLGKVGAFVEVMERTFGNGACKVLNIRPTGAARIEFGS